MDFCEFGISEGEVGEDLADIRSNNSAVDPILITYPITGMAEKNRASRAVPSIRPAPTFLFFRCDLHLLTLPSEPLIS